MLNRDHHQADYSAVELVLNAIADWVSRYRITVARPSGLGQCSPEDVMIMAKDMGVSVEELGKLAGKGHDAADLVQKMLIALNVDPAAIAKTEPAVMRDLQRLCMNCVDKKRCGRELKKGTAAAHFHEFCPNALTLDALFNQKRPAP